jgi:hypothetical protein
MRRFVVAHLGLGEHEPDNGERLEGVVHWEEVENDIDEGLDEVEEAKDDPVGEPEVGFR